MGYLVYTDGSCYHKDRIGSYAWVIIDEDGNMTGPDGEGVEDTTISRMELSGPVAALYECYLLGGASTILLSSDSEYVVKGINDPSRARRCHNDLWDLLEYAVSLHDEVVFEHVKGHATDDTGHPYNVLVDEYAGQLRKDKQDEVRKLS